MYYFKEETGLMIQNSCFSTVFIVKFQWMKNSLLFILILFFVGTFLVAGPCFAQEQVTITTYYPAPYGIYRELRANQMAVGSPYRAIGLNDGELYVSNKAAIGASFTSGKFEVNVNGTDRYFRVNTDNLGVEIRATGGTPYVDFSNDASSDYDIRLIQNTKTITDTGAVVVSLELLPANGGAIIYPLGCVRRQFTPSSGNTVCPMGTRITIAPLAPLSTSGFFLCCFYYPNL